MQRIEELRIHQVAIELSSELYTYGDIKGGGL